VVAVLQTTFVGTLYDLIVRALGVRVPLATAE
jgi:hypothetical protein